MDGIAYLIKEEFVEDKIGQQIAQESKLEIFVTVGSITRSEWSNAGMNGLNAALMMTTAAVNYSGEEIIEYEDVRYLIYRTFNKPDSDEIELYLRKEVGV